MLNSIWIELHQEMPRHPKTLALAQALKVSRHEAVGILADLWTWGLSCAGDDGSLKAVTDMGIAMAVDWPTRKAKALADSLVSVGWLDRDEEGGYFLHDWDDYTGRLNDLRQIKRQQSRERQKRYREKLSQNKKCDNDEKETDDSHKHNVEDCNSNANVTRYKRVNNAPNHNHNQTITEPNRNLTKPISYGSNICQSSLVSPTGEKEALRSDVTDETDVSDPDVVLSGIRSRVEYGTLITRYDREEVDEVINVMVDAICNQAATTRLGGGEVPQKLVRQRMLSLEFQHLAYVLDNRGKSQKPVKNIKRYLLAMLYNSISSCANSEAALYEHEEVKEKNCHVS